MANQNDETQRAGRCAERGAIRAALSLTAAVFDDMQSTEPEILGSDMQVTPGCLTLLLLM